MSLVSNYYDLRRSADMIENGMHRELVGGMWSEIGKLQFEYVKNNGLRSDERFLDIGCGCFRGGAFFIEYLNSGNYYGLDISQDLLDVGYNVELKKLGLQSKQPKNNLHCTEQFDASIFQVEFHYALALSLFTHLTINHIRLCLAQLASVMESGGEFYATVFLCPNDYNIHEPLYHSKGGITTNSTSDPYHYKFNDLLHACEELPWEAKLMKDWEHPRSQSMIRFKRKRDL